MTIRRTKLLAYIHLIGKSRLEALVCGRRAVLRFFAATLSVPLAPFFPKTSQAAKRTDKPPMDVTLAAYLDTLIPGDETPGALQTGGLDHMLAKSKSDLKLKILLHHGTGWLEKQAENAHQKQYSRLNPSAREAIVETAARMPKNSVARIFFDETRRIALRHFYTQPSTWKALNYPGPPQPRGFTDYTHPPT